jgi:glycerol-1-phosphate dehydrogenase [NAD(P)+]
VQASLQAAGVTVRVHVLPGKPRLKPTVDLANSLRDVLAVDGSVPVAVGSGVINDVVKHAAFGLGRDYLCVGTAASMDGYTSAGAPLSDKGFKKTIQCRPARVVLGDLDVIAAAPAEMTGWGYGDLAGKVPAGGDWIIADALGIEAVDDVAWPLVQGGLRGWLGAPKAIAAGDRVALEGLFAGLTLVGLAMELHGSSRPASGADHQIAHLWEMDDLKFGGERVSHGACVAVGCVMSLRLFDWLLAQDLTRLDVDAVVARTPTLEQKIAAVHAAFGPGEIAARSVEEVRAKHVDAGVLRGIMQAARDHVVGVRGCRFNA